MIINLYIDIKRKEPRSEFHRLAELSKWLKENDFPFYDATNFDSCTSGPCAINNLFDIEAAIEGK